MVKVSTFQIALIVIIVVGVLIAIHASWTLSQLNRTEGDSCACSGVSDGDLNGLKMMSVLLLLVGIGIIIYGVIMLLLPMNEKPHHTMLEREGITERYSRRSI